MQTGLGGVTAFGLLFLLLLLLAAWAWGQPDLVTRGDG